MNGDHAWPEISPPKLFKASFLPPFTYQPRQNLTDFLGCAASNQLVCHVVIKFCTVAAPRVIKFKAVKRHAAAISALGCFRSI